MTMTLTAFLIGRVNKKQKKEENDYDNDDDDQWSDEIDQSLENYDDTHANQKLVDIASKAFSQLIFGKKSNYKGPKDCQKVEMP